MTILLPQSLSKAASESNWQSEGRVGADLNVGCNEQSMRILLSMEVKLQHFPHYSDDLHSYSPVSSQFSPEQSKSSFSATIPNAALSITHQQKYQFTGSTIDNHHPHLLSIILQQSPPQQFTHPSKDHQILNAMVESILHNQREEGEKEIVEPKIMENRPQGTRADHRRDQTVAHGYVLTGIAKPSTTANCMFDHIVQFGRVPDPKLANKSSSEQSDIEASSMDEMNKDSYSLVAESMHEAWLRKLHSYEYLKFMSRVYLQLEKQGLSSTQIEQELFFNEKGLVVSLVTKEDEKVQVSDQQYYRYFSDLLQTHAQDIHQQLKISPPLHSRTYTLSLGSLQLELASLDYNLLASALFQGIELSPHSLANIAKTQQTRVRSLIEEYVWRTSEEKLSILKKLQSKSSQFYHQVEVLPLQEKSYSNCRNYLIVVKGLPKTEPEGTASLQQIIQDTITRNNRQANREFALAKVSLFQTMIAQKRSLQECADKDQAGAALILNLFSLHPQHISIDTSNSTELCFREVLEKALSLHSLPLSHEQQMLCMTPSQSIDLYSVLVELMENCQPSKTALQEWDSLEDYHRHLCGSLSSDNLTFCLRRTSKGTLGDLSVLKEEYVGMDKQLQQERIRIKTESQLQRITNIIQLLSDDYIKFTNSCAKYISSQEIMKLLLISIMEFEVKYQERFLLSEGPKEGHAPPKQELSRHSPEEQKEAYQMALLMLICVGAVNHIECKELVSRSRSTLDHYLFNLSRIKVLIEDHFLRNYQLYLRHLYQSVINSQKYSFASPEKSFLNMVDAFHFLLPLLKARNRSLLKTALLLHLQASHLSLVRSIASIPSTLEKMLLIGGTEEPDEYEEGFQLIRDCLEDSHSKMNREILNSNDYLSVPLQSLSQKTNQFSVNELMGVVEDIQLRKPLIEQAFAECKIDKLMSQVKALSSLLELQPNERKKQEMELLKLTKAVLLKEQSQGKPLKEAVEDRSEQNRKGLGLIFLEVYSSGSEARKNIDQRGIQEEVEEEERRTLALLSFFLHPSRIPGRGHTPSRTRFWVDQASVEMLEKFRDGWIRK